MNFAPVSDEVLRTTWHVVARSADVGDGPVAVELLGRALVVARLDDGIAAFDDVCSHRGAALSLGRVTNGCIECPYHGWQYTSDGACSSIPSLPSGRRIPTAARVAPRHCVEQAGLIWVCLDEPAGDVPDLPGTDSTEFAGWRFIIGEPYEWACDPTRRIENFLDFAHFAFVHDGLLGSREHPLVPEHEIWMDGPEMRIHQVRTEPDTGVKPTGGDVGEVVAFATTVDYLVFLPLAALLDQKMPNGERFVLGIASTPLTAAHGDLRSRTYWVLARDYDLDGSDDPYVAFQTSINLQDQPVIESLRPDFVPIDLTDEIHLRDVDAVAIAYRRALRDLSAGTRDSFTEVRSHETPPKQRPLTFAGVTDKEAAHVGEGSC